MLSCLHLEIASNDVERTAMRVTLLNFYAPDKPMSTLRAAF